MEGAEALAQGAVERLLDDERLRGDLTDEGFTPVVGWATAALVAAAGEAARAPGNAAAGRMDEAEAAVRRLVGAIVAAAERHTRAEVAALLNDPAVARDLKTRLRVAANGWRLGDDPDANAIRLVKALRGVTV